MSGKEHTPLQASMAAVIQGSGRNFVESIDVAVRLNIDPRKADQALRGLAVLPHGTGKKVRVAVFASGDAAEAATKAGAVVVGTDDLVEKIKDGFLDFDRAVATPSCMSFATKVARVLGPRGLMPNAKLGTVTDDVSGIIQQLNSGVPYKADKEGNIHAAIAKTNFEAEKLEENLVAFLRTLNDVRPKSVAGQYMLDVFLSSSMGPSYRIEPQDLQARVGGSAAQAVASPMQRAQKKVSSYSRIRLRCCFQALYSPAVCLWCVWGGVCVRACVSVCVCVCVVCVCVCVQTFSSHQVKRGIDPEQWATVDIDSISSGKLRRYLVARRAATGASAGA